MEKTMRYVVDCSLGGEVQGTYSGIEYTSREEAEKEVKKAEQESVVECAWVAESEKYIFTENEARNVLAVYEELSKMKYEDLNKFLGSMTIQTMHQVYNKLHTLYNDEEIDFDSEQETLI